MFFRREQPKELTSEERMEQVVQAGFEVQPLVGGRKWRIRREGCAAIVENVPDGTPRVIERAGLLIGDEVGALVDGGFQKFFQTPSGKRQPALASQLKALHDFEEDLREALGQESLYNEALGTVSTYYLYDRVKGRDQGVPKRAWE
jgi:hypothetical protein